MSFSVAKFGGSSVADFSAMQACAEILANDPTSKVVVLSASAGVTNLLVGLAEGCDEKKRIALLAEIRAIQTNILTKLSPSEHIGKKIDTILAHIEELAEMAYLTPSSMLRDELISQGEILSSLIFTALLQERGMTAQWIDVREIIVTDSHFGQATPQDDLTQANAQKYLLPLIEQGTLIVTQGFIGRNEQGQTTTLGRGGSDYSAALLADVLGAKDVLIWTDVAGIFTTDPRSVPQAYRIDQMSFNEAAEMANFGAKVLHPATIRPALRRNLPVFVGSSKDPKAGGTWVTHDACQKNTVRAVAIRKEQTLLMLANSHPQKSDLVQTFLAVLKKYAVTVDILYQTESTIAMVLDKLDANAYRQEQDRLFCALLSELSHLAPLKVRTGLSLVALVGHHLHADPTLPLALATLKDFAIYAIGEGENHFCLLTESHHTAPMLQALHQVLFEE